MTKLSEKYRLERDSYGWTLYEKKNTINKKTGKSTIKELKTYYGWAEHAYHAILDRELGKCALVDDILDKIQEAQDMITEVVKTREIETVRDRSKKPTAVD